MAGQRTYTMPVTVEVGPLLGKSAGRADGIDDLAEARAERALAARADDRLTEALGGIEALVGRTIGWELTQRAREAQGPLEVACDRYESAVAERDARIAELETELATVTHRCSVLSRDLTDAANAKVKYAERVARQAEKIEHLATVLAEEEAHAFAARSVLAGAVAWTKRATRKKDRPAWLAGAVELLSLRDDGR